MAWRTGLFTAGSDTRVADLARILIEGVGVAVQSQLKPRDVLVRWRAADTSRAKAVLGWAATINVHAGDRSGAVQ